MKFIDQLKKENLDGKKVLLRVDFDLPMVDGKIAEDFRVKSHKESVDYLLENGAKVLLVSHLGHDDPGTTFLPLVDELGEILGHTLTMVPHSELTNVDVLFKAGPLLLLDNTRQDPREVKNDEGLARELAKGFQYYVNDAFAVMHRKHASVVAITKHLPSYAGLLIKKETESLERAIKSPMEGKMLVLGGAKISTKMPVIKNFVDKAEKIFIGGALANNFFQAHGIKIGASVFDSSVETSVRGENIILPRDFITGTKAGDVPVNLYKKITGISEKEAILDIGPETAEEWGEIIEKSRMVIWNGPMGYFEHKDFMEGTEVIAEAVVKADYSVIGGGDTITAVNKLGLLEQFSFVSTGGGAMLEFLAGNELPGLKALNYYESTN